MPDVESVTITTVTFSDSELDNLSDLRVQLNNLLQNDPPTCSGEELALLVANLEACAADLAV